MTDERTEARDRWLSQVCPNMHSCAPASADASFRHYLRLTLSDGCTRIVMDAPPEHEDVRPWMQVQALLDQAGVLVPQILAADVKQGFLLLSDLGDTTYLRALTGADFAQANALYRAALRTLIRVQKSAYAHRLPAYDREMLHRELMLFPQWYVARHCKITLTATEQEHLDTVFNRILDHNLQEPRVFVHRDYHARNLMVVNADQADDRPGVIDFQDAVLGPLSYDLVSLFKDAYIQWPEDMVIDWLVYYWENARRAQLPVPEDFGEFFRAFEWMGVQRHLKVLGIFARLYYRDGKSAYLADMPRVHDYVRAACARYSALSPLLRLLDRLAGQDRTDGYTF
jgi:aminoglycoside/choline kinase family phosphotransferase